MRITSMDVPASSAAMLTAFVITVRCRNLRSARATAVVVVPESRMTDSPSSTDARRRLGDTLLLRAVQLLLLPQARVEQRPDLQRQRAAVRAVHQSLAVQDLQVTPYGHV